MYSLLADNEKIKEILKEFSNVMLVLAVISLSIYFFGSISNIIHPTDTTTISWGGVRTVESYYGIHFNTQRQTLFETSFLRNTGIFAEAPMYSLVLSIALAIELFLKQKKSMWRVILFCITIITTVSITGIILMAFLIIAKFLFVDAKTKTTKHLKLLIIPLIGIIGIYILTTALSLKKNDTASFSVRMDDYKASFLAWKDHLLLGNGYKNDASIIQYMNPSRLSNTGLSNSILVLLAQGGLYLGIFYIFPAIKMILYGVKAKKMNIVTFTVTLLILFSTTIFLYKVLAINFVAMGYAYRKKKINKNTDEIEVNEKKQYSEIQLQKG